MNDFTKEELEILWGACDQYSPAFGMLNKIQSMIDNYCEHEWRCWDDVDNTHECIICAEKRTGQM